MMGVRHIFIYWNFSHNGCAITQQLLERAFERHVSIWMYNFLHNSLPFTLFRSLSRFVISFSRHAWTCSWINATQTVTFQHAFNALKFIRKIEQSILPEIDYVCAFLWSQSQSITRRHQKVNERALTKIHNDFPPHTHTHKMNTSCFIVEFSHYTLVFHSNSFRLWQPFNFNSKWAGCW